MATTFEEFQNLGENRAYPLDDNANRMSIEGELLPNDIIADAHIWFPETAGNYAFVSSLSVSENLVTLTLLASDVPIESPCRQAGSSSSSSSEMPNFVPLGVISLEKSSLVLYRNYPIEAQYPGVGGWIAFGAGIEEHIYSGRFAGAVNTMLAPRVCRKYQGLPVTSAGKLYQSTELTGTILLRGGDDISLTKETRLIGGTETDVLVMALVDDALSRYTGPCGDRPESRTCGKNIIESINGVTPDIQGNIEINFYGGLTEGRDVADSTIVLDFPMSLAEGCIQPEQLPDEDGTLPNEGEDYCVSPTAFYLVSDDFYRPPILGGAIGDDWEIVEGCMKIEDIASGEGAVKAISCEVSSSSVTSLASCPSMGNYVDDFSDGVADHFVPWNDLSPSQWSVGHGEYRVASSIVTNSINMCAYTSINVWIETEARQMFLDQQTGAQANAYIIFGWNPDAVIGTQYWFGGINLTRQTIELGRITAGGRVVEIELELAPLGLELLPRELYTLKVLAIPYASNQYYIQLKVSGGGLPYELELGLATNEDNLTDGPCGLGVVQAWTAFDIFSLTEL